MYNADAGKTSWYSAFLVTGTKALTITLPRAAPALGSASINSPGYAKAVALTLRFQDL
jgi:hypothetical protein